jgi:Superinfection immunity protein
MYAAHYPGAAQVAVIGVPILLYPLPALIAYINRRKHARAIMLLNLSFGWTFLGWVLALLLACMPDNVAQASKPKPQALVFAGPSGKEDRDMKQDLARRVGCTN